MLDLRMRDGTPVTPEARLLADAVSEISQHLRDSAWHYNVEWDVWEELEQWRATGSCDWSDDAVAPNTPRLDQLAKNAGGWVWWRRWFGIEFVPDAEWRRLARVRAVIEPGADNERISEVSEQLNTLPSAPSTLGNTP